MILLTYIALGFLIAISLIAAIFSILGGWVVGTIFATICLVSSGYAMKKMKIIFK